MVINVTIYGYIYILKVNNRYKLMVSSYIYIYVDVSMINYG